VKLTLEEEDLLAKVVWAEARGESPEGQQAVAEVVLNRMVSENFANSLEAVIYGDGQFRSVPVLKDAEPWQAQYDAIEAALYGPNILPLDVVYFTRWETNDNVWGQIGKHIFCYEE
jgi:spore germination cell wall hydrolase CwlJ-like protein